MRNDVEEVRHWTLTFFSLFFYTRFPWHCSNTAFSTSVLTNPAWIFRSASLSVPLILSPCRKMLTHCWLHSQDFYWEQGQSCYIMPVLNRSFKLRNSRFQTENFLCHFRVKFCNVLLYRCVRWCPSYPLQYQGGLASTAWFRSTTKEAVCLVRYWCCSYTLCCYLFACGHADLWGNWEEFSTIGI